MKKKLSRILGVVISVTLLASMIVAAVPVSADISVPSVSVAPASISAPGVYTIKFDTYFPMAAGTDTITIVLPSGTTVPTAYTAGSIEVCNDVGATDTYTAATAVTWTSATRTVAITVPAGEGTTGAAHMGVKFLATSGVLNPSSPGSYTLTVKTSQETTAVTSKTYTIKVPGKVDRYNSDGNFTGTYNDLTTAIAACNDKDVLKIGPGEYAESPTIGATQDEITLESTGTAADTIIKGTLTIAGTKATLDDLTIKGALVVNGATASIKNCSLTKVSSTSGATLLDVNASTTITDSTIDNVWFCHGYWH
jgi:hypothetical protein